MSFRKFLPLAILAALVFATSAAQAADWPMFLNNISRNGATTESLSVPLTQQWVFSPAYAPVEGWGEAESASIYGLGVPFLSAVRHDDAYQVAVVGNYAYFAASAEHKVYCIDVVAGTIRWVAFTDAPCRLAPTVVGTKLYIGSDDGNVYCLNTSDGSLAWKFTAAPDARKCIGQTRMVSVWPVRTSVLVDNGVCYFTAGLYANEGISFYAVNATTGTQIYKNANVALSKKGNVSAQGYMAANATRVFMPTGRIGPISFDRANGSMKFQIEAGCGVNGGSYVMFDGNYLYNGTQSLSAYNVVTANGTKTWTWFKARYGAVANGVMYMVTDTKLIAITLANLATAGGQGTTPDYTKCSWQLTETVPDAVIVAGDKVFAGGPNKVIAANTSDGAKVWEATVDGNARGLAVANGRLYVSTSTGKIYCFGTGGTNKTIAPPANPNAYPVDSLTPFYTATADAIVNGSGITSGFALVLGGGNGRLAYELAKRTNLHIIMREPDPAKAAEARTRLHDAGLYGARVTVEEGSLASLPYPAYFADLVVSEEGFFGATVSTTRANELSRVMRPCGGVAYVGQPGTWNASYGGTALNSSAVQAWTAGTFKLHASATAIFTGAWAKINRAKLPGSGEWTHQNASAANDNCSNDQLVTGPFKTLWFGAPSAKEMIERHARPPAPLVVGGRLFYLGEDVVMCYDAYNGRFLWKRSISGTYRRHMPFETSNLAAANSDSVFVLTGNLCHRLDGKDGHTIQTYTMPANPAGARRWAWLGVVGNTLYGSRNATNSQLRDWPQISDNLSEAVFALDITTGAQKWIYTGAGIPNIAIVVGDNKVFFLNRVTTTAQAQQAYDERVQEVGQFVDRYGKTIPADPAMIVCLDATTGAKLWERPRDLADCKVNPGPADAKTDSCGGEPTIMYKEYNQAKYLVLCSSPFHEDHELTPYNNGDFNRRSLSVYNAANGTKLWGGSKNYQTRPLIVGNVIYAEPRFFDLTTGVQKTTNGTTLWEFFRGYAGGCGGWSASADTLFCRGNNNSTFDGVGYYNLDLKGSMQGVISGQRPSCWMSYTPAGGVLVMPEGSAECTCAYAVQASTTMYNPDVEPPPPAPEAKCWVFYNNSRFDGNNAAANAADDAAIATDKVPLRPGMTASFANYTSYSKGINGIIVDIPAMPGTPTTADFAIKVGNSNTPSSWVTLPVVSVSVRRGAGVDGYDRVTLIWPDNMLMKTWVQITAKATAATGLLTDQVFYYGNAIGETGNSTTSARVDTSDGVLVRQDPHKTFINPAEASNNCDFDRNGKVDTTDEIICRQNATTFLNELKLITVP